jgi:hypothetical protein
MIKRRCGAFAVTVYDPTTQGKRWVGTFGSEHEAREAEAHAKAGRPYVRHHRRKARLEHSPVPVVYFILAPTLGLVKIGFSEDVGKRYNGLSHASPVELRFLHSIPGDVALERQFHERFAIYKTRGEWFKLTGGLATFLEESTTPEGGDAR